MALLSVVLPVPGGPTSSSSLFHPRIVVSTRCSVNSTTDARYDNTLPLMSRFLASSTDSAAVSSWSSPPSLSFPLFPSWSSSEDPDNTNPSHNPFSSPLGRRYSRNADLNSCCVSNSSIVCSSFSPSSDTPPLVLPPHPPSSPTPAASSSFSSPSFSRSRNRYRNSSDLKAAVSATEALPNLPLCVILSSHTSSPSSPPPPLFTCGTSATALASTDTHAGLSLSLSLSPSPSPPTFPTNANTPCRIRLMSPAGTVSPQNPEKPSRTTAWTIPWISSSALPSSPLFPPPTPTSSIALTNLIPPDAIFLAATLQTILESATKKNQKTNKGFWTKLRKIIFSLMFDQSSIVDQQSMGESKIRSEE